MTNPRVITSLIESPVSTLDVEIPSFMTILTSHRSTSMISRPVVSWGTCQCKLPYLIAAASRIALRISMPASVGIWVDLSLAFWLSASYIGLSPSYVTLSGQWLLIGARRPNEYRMNPRLTATHADIYIPLSVSIRAPSLLTIMS